MLSKIRIYAGYLLLFIFDIISLFLIFFLSVYTRTHILPFFIKDLPVFENTFKYFWILLVFLVVFLYEGLYTKRFSLWDEIKTEIKSILISFVLIFFILFITKKGYEYSRAFLISYFFLLIIFFPFLRMIAKRIIYSLNLMTRRVLIVGSSKNSEQVIKAIKNEKNLGYIIAGIIDDKKDSICGYKIHTGLDQIERYIKFSYINDVIITKDDLSKEETEKLINKIQHKVSNTVYIPDIAGIAVSGTDIKYFFQEQLIGIEIKNNLSNPLTYLTKRMIDYILSLIIFILIIPVMILIAVLIKLSDKGPVIYSHKRIGKNAKEFNCYKFRTMYVDADKKLKEILEKDPQKKKEWETYWKLKDDPRVTKIGKFLRKTSLDELPQIFNVLKGEMSLVGPRPYLPREWDYIKDESSIIHALPPGITGLWQVSGRNNEDYNYRIIMDCWYVKNWNLWLDIVILIKTIRAVIKREGAC